MVTRIVVGLSCMAVLGFFNNAQGASKVAMPAKIAYVNVQRIVPFDEKLLPQASTEWREFYVKLKETVEPAHKEIAELHDKFEKGKKEYQSMQSSGLTSQESLKRKYEEVGRMEYDLAVRRQEVSSFTQSEIEKAQAQIGPKLDKVINSIRIAQGWDFVLRGEGVVLSVDEKFDITQEVVEKLNKEYAEMKAKETAKGKEAPKKPKAL